MRALFAAMLALAATAAGSAFADDRMPNEIQGCWKWLDSGGGNRAPDAIYRRSPDTVCKNGMLIAADHYDLNTESGITRCNLVKVFGARPGKYRLAIRCGQEAVAFVSNMTLNGDQLTIRETPYADEYSDVHKRRWQTLFDAYRHYGFIKYCNETRRGYLAQWVNEDELGRARSHVKHLEDEAKEVWGDEIDTDKLYKSALTYITGLAVGAQTCHFTYVQTLSIRDAKGRTGFPAIEKDF